MTNDFTSDGLYIHALREMPEFTAPGRPRKPKPGESKLSKLAVCVCARPIVWGQGQRGRCERCGGHR
jgi:hypothetical protein